MPTESSDPSDALGGELPPPLPTSPTPPPLPAPWPDDSRAGWPAVGNPPPLPGPVARPRVWTVFAAIAAGIGGGMALAIGAAMVATAVLVVGGMGQEELEDAFEEMLATPWGLIVASVVGQAAFLGAAVGAAWRSPQPALERLGLVRGRMSVWGTPVLMAGTLFVMFNSMIAAGVLLGEPSDSMEEFSEGVAGATGVLLGLLFVAISVIPGFAEELLFRGYAQRRLVERWGPVAGIAVTSIMFAAAHIDLYHAATVLPLGVWLGVIAWRAGAVWPGMACHFGNNAVAVLMAQAAGEGSEEAVGVVFLGAWLVTGTAFVGSVLLLVFAGGKRAPATVRA